MSPTISPATTLDLCEVLKSVLKTLFSKNILPGDYCASLSARKTKSCLIEAMTVQIGEPADHEVRKNQRRASEQGLRAIECGGNNRPALSSKLRNPPLDAYGGAVVANGFIISVAGRKEGAGEQLDEALAVLLMTELKQLTRQQALLLMAEAKNAHYRFFDMAHFGI